MSLSTIADTYYSKPGVRFSHGQPVNEYRPYWSEDAGNADQRTSDEGASYPAPAQVSPISAPLSSGSFANPEKTPPQSAQREQFGFRFFENRNVSEVETRQSSFSIRFGDHQNPPGRAEPRPQTQTRSSFRGSPTTPLTP